MFSGHTITLKRASKVLVNAARLQAERDRNFDEKQDRILSLLEDVQTTLLRVTCVLDMRKKINLDHFFPVKSLQDLLTFMNKSDGQFDYRREEFENMLYCNVTKNLKLKRPFESYLLATLFSRDFISSHKWPCPRYHK